MMRKKQTDRKRIYQVIRKQIKENRKRIYQAAGLAVVALALLGIFLPGRILMWQSEEEMDMVDAVPVEYYSPANLAVARNASANLGVYQKLQLITGKWESNIEQVDFYERELENYEAVELAKEQMNALYREGLYPGRLLSAYSNWYSWTAELYKAVDATFNTYAAYYWDIQFEKYDGSERHHIYMLEDGTIFLAEAWKKNELSIAKISKISEVELDSELKEKGVVRPIISETEWNPAEYFTLADIDTTDLQRLDIQQFGIGEYAYHVLQAYSADRYVYSLQAVD